MGGFGPPHKYDPADFKSWDMLKSAISSERKPSLIVPVYFSENPTPNLSASAEPGPWRRSQVGFAYVGRLLEFRGLSDDETRRRAMDIITTDLEAYNNGQK
jgi:hypothetical protein